MKIASYNVAGIRARADHFWPWLEREQPDSVLIQEIKAQDDTFPFERAATAGYQAHVVGQKGFNGVAIMTKGASTLVIDHLPGEDDDRQARYLEVDYHGLRLACLYLPNGNPINDPVKFPYKLRWMARLKNRMAATLSQEIPALFGGDYNVCPSPKDIWDEAANASEAHVQPEVRAAWFAMKNLGLTEVRGANHDFTFWDFQAGRFQKDQGLNIDFMLVTPQLADRLLDAGVDQDARNGGAGADRGTDRGADRGASKPSDHAPIWATFSGLSGL